MSVYFGWANVNLGLWRGCNLVNLILGRKSGGDWRYVQIRYARVNTTLRRVFCDPSVLTHARSSLFSSHSAEEREISNTQRTHNPILSIYHLFIPSLLPPFLPLPFSSLIRWASLCFGVAESITALSNRTAKIASRGMQQSDQTVLSLRPGGGKGSRLLGPRFDSSSSSSASPAFGSFSADLPLLRPHGGSPSPFSIKVSIPFPWICLFAASIYLFSHQNLLYLSLFLFLLKLIS